MRSTAFPRAIFALVSLAAQSAAQGSDDCSGATAIHGHGLFAFDLSSATTDGAPDRLCDPSSGGQIENDVWFAWTAMATEARWQMSS